MTSLSHISLPATREGKAIAKYIKFQETKDFSGTDEIFCEDVIFSGMLFQASGREKIISGFHDFLNDMLVAIRMEAIAEAGANKYLILLFVKLTGQSQEMAICDLVSMRDGKICRIDNCFDTSKVPEEIVKKSAEMSSN